MVEDWEEIERLDKALHVVERYEGYLFRRTLGVALIICGILFPVTAIMVLNAQTIAGFLNIDAEAFRTFGPTLVLLIGTAIIVYIFTSTNIVASRMRKESVWKDLPRMIFLFLVWFFSFYLISFVPEPYSIISWLWAGGGASFLSYLLAGRDHADARFTELVIIGFLCFFSSIPLIFVRNESYVLTATFLVFSASFIFGGVYSIFIASKMLSAGEV